MKRTAFSKNMKRIFAAVLSLIFLLLFSPFASAAKKDEIPFSQFPVSSEIAAGGSESYTVSVDIKGSLGFTVDTDSSEGYVYLYDKHGKIIEREHYTKSGAVHISSDVKKGRYTLEVTRTPASKGSGKVTVNGSFAMNLEAFIRRIGTSFFIIFAIAVGASMMMPRYGRGARGRLHRENGRLVFRERGLFDSIERIADIKDLFRKLF